MQTSMQTFSLVGISLSCPFSTLDKSLLLNLCCFDGVVLQAVAQLFSPSLGSVCRRVFTCVPVQILVDIIWPKLGHHDLVLV